ncbi:FtsK/SpoIIIE domain-containing protein [Plantactinospora sp. GCM10030261]|uniref:FtsK/SpoIIIE domain-containing protein n=1 Tax=Plantactinospora sp. GCM10030261 TaxID=3273420 RepID=UPI00361E2B2F
MASLKSRTARAAALHRQAAAVVTAVASVLDADPPAAADEREQRDLVERLRVAGARLAPGWLGDPLTASTSHPALGSGAASGHVRIGVAEPVTGVRFPAIVPLLGTGHLTMTADATDHRVGGLLRSLLLRLLAATTAGSLLVRAVTDVRTTVLFEPFAPLIDAGLMPPPATDRAGLLTVLTEAERWVGPSRSGAARRRRRDRTMLVVIAALPPDVEPDDLGRVGELARSGVSAGLHLMVAGWPSTDPLTAPQQHPATVPAAVDVVSDAATAQSTAPPPPAAPSATARPAAQGPATARPASPPADARHVKGPLPVHTSRVGLAPASPALADATVVTVFESYAVLGDPPGASFGGRGPLPAPGGLDVPVLLDSDPPAALVDRVCRDLAARFAIDRRPDVADLLPDDAELWTENAADGLTTIVGHDGDTPVTLRFSDVTPHWMVAGRPGVGTTSFVANLVYGLAARYRPDGLAIHLLNLRPAPAFGEFLPTDTDRSWLPHIRTAGVGADREYGLALLRELDAELDHRQIVYERAGVGRFSELPERDRPPRVICLVEGVADLLVEGDRTAREAGRRLESVARRGRSYGVHLLLVSRPGAAGPTVPGPGGSCPDALLGQFPVRIALPGGGEVLEPTNESAADLPPGAAVVNTAGGLGGPRGATRGHERIVRFPDPRLAAPVLAELRNQLWLARPTDDEPRVFTGSASARLDDDPAYRARLAAGVGPLTALLGRCVTTSTDTAAFTLDEAPGRHLAVVGRSTTGVEVLDAAARSVAAVVAPGAVRFAVASLVEEADAVADELVSALRTRHEVDIVDAAGLLKELDADRPGFVVVFGMDAAGAADLPREQVRAALSSGPARGVHLLSWWRRTRRLVELAGDRPLGDYVAGVLLLDLPAIEAEYLLGRDADWRPRPGRATMFDARSGTCTLVVPFRRSGGVR